MKTRRTNTSVVDTQFDEWAKAVAHGLTRRKVLQLLSGGLTGALMALRGPKASAAPAIGVKGCGHICAPLFNPHNQGAFEACTQACDDCKSCRGIPMMTSMNSFMCNNATPCRNAGSGLICCSSGQNCCAAVCCTGTCCGGNCCPSNMECCGSTCVSPCSPGYSLDPQTCQCVCDTPCAGGCCQSGEICCGTTCVSASAVCCGGRGVCSSGEHCCGANCCPKDTNCCMGGCIPFGRRCIRRSRSDRNGFVLVRKYAPERWRTI